MESLYTVPEMNLLIREWRKYFRMSQSKFGDKVGVSQKIVSKWEGGYTVPTDESVNRMAGNLGLDLQDFLEGPEAFKQKTKLKEQPSVPIFHVQSGVLERLSSLYALSGVRDNMERSHPLGWVSAYSAQKNPDEFCQVFIDEPGEIAAKGFIAGVRLGQREWTPEDTVLFYRPGDRAHIRKFKETQEGDLVLGTVQSLTQPM